jgi:hypothetical protein
VSVLEAQNLAYEGFFLNPNEQAERMRGSHAVVGGHLSGRNHQFTAVRVHFQTMIGPVSAADNVPGRAGPVSLERGGTVRLEQSSTNAWLTLSGILAASLRIDRAYLQPLASLLALAYNVVVNPLSVEVRETVGGAWCPVHTQSIRAEDLEWPWSALLRDADMDAESIGRWLDRVQTLGPLPPVLAGVRNQTLESQVLQLTTLAEGLHRRPRPEVRRFDEAHAEGIRAAAVQAAASIDETAEDAVSGLLSHLYEPGYALRLVQLAERAHRVAPGVAGPPKRISRWNP